MTMLTPFLPRSQRFPPRPTKLLQCRLRQAGSESAESVGRRGGRTEEEEVIGRILTYASPTRDSSKIPHCADYRYSPLIYKTFMVGIFIEEGFRWFWRYPGFMAVVCARYTAPVHDRTIFGESSEGFLKRKWSLLTKNFKKPDL